ncbi:MAG: AlpA family phage regulatory protein [Caldimonas sp.]
MRLLSIVSGTGLVRSTIYKPAQHQFPAPVQLGGRAVGWRRGDIERWTLRC